MGSVIGEILPLALGIAISPIPIIAAILMLLSPLARTTGLGFLAGWVLGVIVAVVVFTLLASILPESGDDGPKPIAGVITIILGLGLLFLAFRQWRSRPHDGGQPALPKWMAAIDSMTAVRGFLLGFALSALNPKNLLMGVGAGVAIGSGDLTIGATTLVIVIFTLIAASTVALPVIAYLVASAKVAGPLEALHQWLLRNNATVMAILLLIIGVVLIGKGIGSF
ncbi:GAP family protein [Herbiconiux ginsengi]|uniref:Sap, sulfolipid-1-addressing protein n=1 Tax=Herbiconiux ginsengi TaxID=381665 RepID=A0A1H3KAA7_9MICO|nr:GAP family protein [Herbiconiux ginsengi]SDY48528.1 Sap, sulfolipid-1-addressing protein [Herbiconiux ginsengi]